ncbi:unnamed protein product [Pseudo-nitzschia multistriata]|uniref:Uncharacterized protein n=1 Tax=Pseudo-nitzschia multistriata TaxID=183589 RepID=A0A448YVQ0_9STRA|nr:unnamed protein product [Pseudo-nitzschia multistriata]
MPQARNWIGTSGTCFLKREENECLLGSQRQLVTRLETGTTLEPNNRTHRLGSEDIGTKTATSLALRSEEKRRKDGHDTQSTHTIAMATPPTDPSAAPGSDAGRRGPPQPQPPGDESLADAFVRAFDKQRPTLAGFARCSNLDELRIVRDGFYLGMAKDLCPEEYKRLVVVVLERRFAGGGGGGGGVDTGIVEGGNHGMLSMSFEEMVLAARACDEEEEDDDDENHGDHSEKQKNQTETDATNEPPETEPEEEPRRKRHDPATAASPAAKDPPDDRRRKRCWKDLLESLFAVAEAVGSDLASIWGGLENGRLRWLAAVAAAHPLKAVLKEALALEEDASQGEALMVWIYALCVHLSANVDAGPEPGDPSGLAGAVEDWVVAVEMKDPVRPLEGFRSELWDPARDEWRPLDVGAQEAAEKGGADLLEAWGA